MRVPERLIPLIEQGILQEVVRPLMSGKEAEVFLVLAGDQPRVAKVYKEANDRSFRQRVTYTEGRKVRNSRQQRAMDKGSRYGKEQIEAGWRSAEVDAIYRLRAAGVRVPEPFDYVDGVLVMEYICDEHGEPAPRLADLAFEPDDARALFHQLLGEVVRMLCAGLVHGDLSDFNVLLGTVGPVIIDFPQAVDSAHNNAAQTLLIRDVDNLKSFLARYAPDLEKPYGEEMWDLYTRNALRPDTVLTGVHRPDDRETNTNALLAEIDELAREAKRRREALGLPMRPARKPREAGPPPKPVSAAPREKAREKPREKPREKKRPADPFADLDALLLTED